MGLPFFFFFLSFFIYIYIFFIAGFTIKAVPKCRMCMEAENGVHALAYIECNQRSLFFNCCSNGKRFSLMVVFLLSVFCAVVARTHIYHVTRVLSIVIMHFNLTLLAYDGRGRRCYLVFICNFIVFSSWYERSSVNTRTNDLHKKALDGWEIKPNATVIN